MNKPHGFHFARVAESGCDALCVAEAVAYFRDQHAEAQAEVRGIRGRRIAEVSASVAAWAEFRYAQWKEVTAILEVVKRRQAEVTQEARRRYLEHYNRTLSDNMANRYAENDATVAELAALRIEVEFVVGLFEGVTKAHEMIHYQVKNLTMLRAHQIEDAII